MKKKRALFIQSSIYGKNKRKIVKQRRLYLPGLAPVLLASYLEDYFELDLCYETIEEIPFDREYDIVFISSMGHSIIRAIDIAREFKERYPSIKVVFGGYMASLMVDECLKWVDSVVVGDGEKAIVELSKDFYQNNLKPVYKMPLKSLKGIKKPRYELLVKKKIGDWLPVFAGRGCPHVCSFCSVYCIYRGRYLRRPIGEVIEDIKIIKRLGYNKILLLDDNVAADGEYMLALAKELEKLDIKWMGQCDVTLAENEKLLSSLARSGCVALSFGLESISQETLNSLHKAWAKVYKYRKYIEIITKAGIGVTTEMVLGGEGDTLESIRETENFIKKSYIIAPRFYILTPIPGTDFYREMMAQGRIIENDIYKYDGSFAVHRPRRIPPDILTREYWRLYERLFSFSQIITRILKHSPYLEKDVLAFFFLVNLTYKRFISQRVTPNIV